MPEIKKQHKFQFWIEWTLWSTLIIPVSYLIGLILVGIVADVVFHDNLQDWGSPFSQTAEQLIGVIVLGLGTGIYQRILLKKIFKVPCFWIYSVALGFVAAELITAIVLWQMNLNRMQLRFIEFNPLPEALIFAFAGLMVGLVQWWLLRSYFSGRMYWISASTLGWGISVFIYYFTNQVLDKAYAIFSFIPGTCLYGAITGATLMWLMKKRKPEIAL